MFTLILLVMFIYSAGISCRNPHGADGIAQLPQEGPMIHSGAIIGADLWLKVSKQNATSLPTNLWSIPHLS